MVAVVPFVDLAGDEASRRLGEAFYEPARTIWPVPRVPDGAPRPDLRLSGTAGARLAGRYVLGGTVDRQGDRLRVTAQLTSGRTGERVVGALGPSGARRVRDAGGGRTGYRQPAGRRDRPDRGSGPGGRARETPGRAHRVGPAAARERAAALGTRAGIAERGAARRGRVARSGARARRACALLHICALPSSATIRPATSARRRRCRGGARPRPRRRLGLRRPRREPRRGGTSCAPGPSTRRR